MLQPSLFRDYPRRIRRTVFAAVVLVALGVLGYRVTVIFTPPPLALESPQDRSATSSRTVTIRGTTAPGAALTINGQPLVPDPRGSFTAEIVLLPGVNTITLEARTAHSWPARIERRIRVTTAEGPVAALWNP